MLIQLHTGFTASKKTEQAEKKCKIQHCLLLILDWFLGILVQMKNTNLRFVQQCQIIQATMSIKTATTITT